MTEREQQVAAFDSPMGHAASASGKRQAQAASGKRQAAFSFGF